MTVAGDRTTMMTTVTEQEGTDDPDQHQDAIWPEKMDQWLALADSYAKDVNSEDGCLFFQFARSLTSDSEFVCIEGFTDAEAGAAHVRQPTRRSSSAPHRTWWPPSRRSSTSTPRMTASARWARSSLADRLRPPASPQLRSRYEPVVVILRPRAGPARPPRSRTPDPARHRLQITAAQAGAGR